MQFSLCASRRFRVVNSAALAVETEPITKLAIKKYFIFYGPPILPLKNRCGSYAKVKHHHGFCGGPR
jgi:hypothetical protein